MFINSMDPVLFSLGPFEVRYYGIVYLLGFLALYFILRYYSRAKRIKLSYDDVDSLMLYLIIGVLLGSRLFEILFWQPGYYFSDPIKILYIWQGGMSFHGGLVGCIIATYIFTRKYKVKFLEIADIISVPAIFFLALGRIANFINGELPGKISDASWCVQFRDYTGCRHPYQIYSAAARFFVFGWLLYLSSKRFKAGFIFWNFLLFDGIARFILDFWKDFDATFLGLTAGQYFSLVMIAVAAYFLIARHRNDIEVIF